MSWSALWGHHTIKKTLLEAVEKARIGHAYIFEGQAGVGKMTAANLFAREIVGCPEGMKEHPDIITVTNARFEEKGGNTLSIDTVRAMKRDVYIRPFLSERKVYIIPDADRMLPVAQNGLLKVFEEPPPYCTILLLTENANVLLETIRSRAVHIRFYPLETQTVAEYLLNRGIEEKRARVLAVMSGGSIGRALELLDDDAAVGLREEVIGGILSLSSGGNKSGYDLIKYMKRNKGEMEMILSCLEGWFSDVLRYKTAGGQISPVNIDKMTEIERFSGLITQSAAYQLCEITVKYRQMIKQNANFPIAVLCMVMDFEEAIHGRNYRSTI